MFDSEENGVSFYNRVVSLGKARGLKSAQAICKAAKVDIDFLRKIRDGENRSPDTFKIGRIAAALGTTFEELLGASTSEYRDARTPGTQTASLAIDELDVRPSAGHGTLPEAHSEDVVTGRWSLPQPLVRMQTSAPAQALKIISVNGDSMVPDFLPGERVLVDTSHKVPSPPGVYVLWDGFGVVVKRVEIIPNSEPMSVRLIPRNGQYATYERRLDDVTIHARVVGKWTWT